MARNKKHEYKYIEPEDGNRFVGAPVMYFDVGQCTHCEYRKYTNKEGVDFSECPLRLPAAFGDWDSPSDIDDWERRCPERVQRPEFAEEDAKLFKEHFPEKE